MPVYLHVWEEALSRPAVQGTIAHCFQGVIAHSILQDCRGMVYFHMPVLPLAEVYTRAHGAGQGVWKISVVILCCAGRSVC